MMSKPKTEEIPIFVADWSAADKWVSEFPSPDGKETPLMGIVIKAIRCKINHNIDLIFMPDVIADLLMRMYPKRELVTSTLLSAVTVEPLGIPDREEAVFKLMYIKMVEKRPVFLVTADASIIALKKKGLPILSIEEAHKMVDGIEHAMNS